MDWNTYTIYPAPKVFQCVEFVDVISLNVSTVVISRHSDLWTRLFLLLLLCI
jgi:hypothetical protein